MSGRPLILSTPVMWAESTQMRALVAGGGELGDGGGDDGVIGDGGGDDGMIGGCDGGEVFGRQKQRRCAPGTAFSLQLIFSWALDGFAKAHHVLPSRVLTKLGTFRWSP